MKQKCPLCETEIVENSRGICKTCLRFLEWKYKDNPKELKRRKKLYKNLFRLNSKESIERRSRWKKWKKRF